MSDDICDRLVRFSQHKQCMSTDLEVETAVEITRLREENARLEASNKKLNDDLFKQSELTAVTMTRCADLMPAQSAIVKLKEQQVEIERMREENARLREALKGVIRIADRNTIEFDAAAAAIREGEE